LKDLENEVISVIIIIIIIQGLNTPTPFLKIGSMIFKGFYEECIGTNIIFDKDKLDGSNKESYFAHGTKKIVFQRIILEQKSTKEDNTINLDSITK
jgi:hypothetical protein